MTETSPKMREEGKVQRNGESEPAVVIEHLVKQFGKLRAIDNLNMTINSGETFGLIGPNGSGKTTLIRMVVGLSRPTGGTIHIMKEKMPSSKVSPHLGYMPQLSALYLDLTARENMRFFCNIYGLRGKEQSKRIQEMLERVDLADRANDVVGKFSGGMRQRLSLACALVHGPHVVFLDEPTVGVDPELRRTFWDYFAQLNREGITIVVSTHQLDEASRCTRLGLMRLGKLLAQDVPQQLLLQSGKDNMEDAFLYYASRQEEIL
jgi:ABC-2 type transport system ATP-binding protein